VRAAIAVAAYTLLFVLLLLRLAATQTDALSLVQVIAYLVIAANAIGVGAFACIAMNAVSRENFRNEQVIERQRRSIAVQKSRSDRLLASILPDAVSERLKGEPGMIADHYPFVSVVFADIVGFTELATRLKPDALVTLLNDLFSRFDELAAEHGVERIKTIGDAYMAAAGVPIERADYAVAVAHFALAARDAVREHAAAHGAELAIRIGIGSGAVVAGVVGTTRFAYDLWGDTVNVASRMESQGEAGAIQVCARTHALLADRFKFKERGEIDVAGRGPMQTYFLLGRM
jgi:class 3 adenylate cyclase